MTSWQLRPLAILVWPDRLFEVEHLTGLDLVRGNNLESRRLKDNF